MTVTDEAPRREGERAGILPSHVRGLLWREWLAHRGAVVGSFAVYFALGWALMIFYHPGFIIGYGAVVASFLGILIAGADAAEGSEEFVFSLPPGRSERYLVRLALGGGTVLALTAIGALSIAFDLPQKLWGLVVQTGFTEPFPGVYKPIYLWLYPAAVAFPLALFAFTFMAAARSTTRMGVVLSCLGGMVFAAGVFSAGALMEYVLMGGLNGWLIVPWLFVTAAGALTLGYLLYLRKEGISRPAPMSGGGAAWVWAIVIVGIVLLAVFFGWFSLTA